MSARPKVNAPPLLHLFMHLWSRLRLRLGLRLRQECSIKCCVFVSFVI